LLACIGVIFSRQIATRFSYTVRDAPERIGLWKDGLKIVHDFRWFGTGMGTFKYVLPNYRSQLDFLDVNGVQRQAYWNFAHNDYLQLLIECGVLGFALALWAIYWTFEWLAEWRAQATSDAGNPWALSCLGGVIALLLHSLVDFNLHIPANALVFCILLSLAIVGTYPKHALTETSRLPIE